MITLNYYRKTFLQKFGFGERADHFATSHAPSPLRQRRPRLKRACEINHSARGRRQGRSQCMTILAFKMRRRDERPTPTQSVYYCPRLKLEREMKYFERGWRQGHSQFMTTGIVPKRAYFTFNGVLSRRWLDWSMAWMCIETPRPMNTCHQE